MLSLPGILLALSALSAGTTPITFRWDNIRSVVAFGDSYTFVQGSQGHPAFSFIGDALNFSFTPNQLLSDEILPKNTSSDGANWVEFLTGCFDGQPLKCKKQLWNFAFAGADIDATLLPRHHDFTVPLVDQVRQWVEYALPVIRPPTAKTLTIWWIGINDTGDTISNSSITDFPAFWEAEMNSYFAAVQEAYDHGLRMHLFLNVPPGERSPANIGDATKAAALKENIDLFNEALDAHTRAFAESNQGRCSSTLPMYEAKTLQGAIVITFDAQALFNELLNNADQYGFTNTTGFCTCSDPAFFWFNSGHPTERVHKMLAEAVDTHLRNISVFH